uniref:Uncharacterized protein n=1 Tax=Arundo donax TaxID=35708 RepID=A0A0A9D555_ARUDO
MPSATRNAGLRRHLPQKAMWSLSASSSPAAAAPPPPPPLWFVLPLAASSRTASAQSPQSHRPPKAARTPRM